MRCSYPSNTVNKGCEVARLEKKKWPKVSGHFFFDYANTNSEPTTASGPNSKIPRFIGAFGN